MESPVLTDALTKALDPNTKEEGLTALAAMVPTDPAQAFASPKYITAGLILAAFRIVTPYTVVMSRAIRIIAHAGANQDAIVTLLRRAATPYANDSAEWATNALSLAAWADAQATP